MTSSELSTQGYTFLQTYIQRESGIVLDEDKHYLIESRLLPIVREEKLASLDELCGQLASGRRPTLATRVIDAMTTNETLFFRDPSIFEALRTAILPELMAGVAGKRKLRIWSAASSTGQEAYSIAITLLEAGCQAQDVEIIGTDLSETALERARVGRYVQFEVNRGLSAPLLTRYFSRSGLEWQISDQVRSMASFQKIDLRGSLAALGTCDLVLCRNVLIYFNADTKSQILGSIAQTLIPGGFLVLGCAETLIGVNHGYQRRVVGQSTFYTL
jgi:chemotaxis protein methyltransferase CheR